MTAPRNIAAALGVLVCLSGATGLAYEILYIRSLSTFVFGDSYIVTAAVLAGVFAGIAVGSLGAGHWAKYLWLFELLLGVGSIAFAIATLFYEHQLVAVIPVEWKSANLFAFAAGFVPFSFIGAQIPCYAVLLQRYGVQKGGFRLSYAAYSVGAAAAILAVFYGLLPAIGISKSIFLFGIGNIIIAAFLFPVCRKLSPPRDEDKPVPSPVARLLAFGAASTIFQSALLDINLAIYGPYFSTFILTIFTAITGNAIGAAVSPFIRSPLVSIACAAAFAVAFFVFMEPWISFVIHAANGIPLGESSGSHLARFVFVVAPALPVFIAFGAFVPQLSSTPARGAWILGFTAAGNGAGILLYIFFLRGTAPYHLILAVIITLLAVAAFLFVPARRMLAIGVSTTLAATLAASAQFPNAILTLGHYTFASHDIFHHYRDRLRAGEITVHNFSSYSNITHLVRSRATGQPSVSHNGYLVFALHAPAEDDAATPSRKLVADEENLATFSAMFTARRNRAYAVGQGSGITVQKLGALFRSVVVAEINPAMQNVIATGFSVLNKDVARDDNIAVRYADAFVDLAQETNKFDLILSHSSSSKYYAAAKLYSANFFRHAAARLAPGGVFAVWSDAAMRRGGNAILVHTLNSVFAECRHFAIRPAYWLHICGNHSLRMQNDNSYSARLMRASEIPRDKFLAGQRRIIATLENLPLAEPAGVGTPFNTPLLHLDSYCRVAIFEQFFCNHDKYGVLAAAAIQNALPPKNSPEYLRTLAEINVVHAVDALFQNAIQMRQQRTALKYLLQLAILTPLEDRIRKYENAGWKIPPRLATEIIWTNNRAF